MSRQSKIRALPFSLAVLVAMMIGCAAPAAAPTEATLTASEIIDKSSERIQGISSFHFALDQEGGGTPIAMGLEMNGAAGDVTSRMQQVIESAAQGLKAGAMINATLTLA